MADARLAAQSVEAASDGTPDSQLSAVTVETLTNNAGSTQRRLSATAVEALTNSATPPKRQLSAISIEVLVPRRAVFAGWGVPIKLS